MECGPKFFKMGTKWGPLMVEKGPKNSKENRFFISGVPLPKLPS